MDRNFENPQFIADKVIAQEIVLMTTINAWMRLYPEITEAIIHGLDHVLGSSAIPTAGARTNLETLRAQIAWHQPPTPPSGD